MPERCPNSAPRAYDLHLSADPPRITFRPCGNSSTYPIDIETRYCRVCQMFIENEMYYAPTDPEIRDD